MFTKPFMPNQKIIGAPKISRLKGDNNNSFFAFDIALSLSH